MRTILAAMLLLSLLLAGCDRDPKIVNQAQKAEAAKGKAEVLEQKASAEGSKALPTPAETITKSQAHSVDPTGQEPLDDAITCLARSIYWEANRKDNAEMEAIANVVMNRLGHKGFPNTICGVVKQGHEQAPASSRGGAMAVRMAHRRKSRTRTPRKSPARPSTGNSRTQPMVLCISTIGKSAQIGPTNISRRSRSASTSSTSRLAARPNRLGRLASARLRTLYF